jgi:hypothetical protein
MIMTGCMMQSAVHGVIATRLMPCGTESIPAAHVKAGMGLFGALKSAAWRNDD